MKFPGCRFHRGESRPSLFQVAPKRFAGQFIQNHLPPSRGNRPKTVAVEHIETFEFPKLPGSDVVQEKNGNT